MTKPPYTADERIPIALSPNVEREILGRVKQDVMAAHLDGENTSSSRGYLWWSLGGAIAAACVAFVLWSNIPGQAPLQQRGLIAQSTKRATTYHTNNKKNGFISRPKHWRIDLTGATALGVHKGTKQRQHVALHKGQLKIHVTPNAMKQFTVQAGAYRVEVKGTRFSVERHTKWLRVEVTRGKVMFHGPQQTPRAITKGQGCRVATPNGSLQCYHLPHKGKHTPMQHVRRLGQHDPTALMQFLSDMTHRAKWSKTLRAALIREAIESFHRHKQWQNSLKSYKMLAALHVADSNQALVDAALHCRKNISHHTKLCQSIFQQCLRQCNDPTWKEQSLGMLAFSRYQQASHSKTQAINTIKHYLTRYPKGTWQKDLRRLLVRHAIVQGKSCNAARRLLQPGDPGEGWFVKRCQKR